MSDLLAIIVPQVVLGMLVATSGALVGLLALWAAWSPRHWFLRTAVVGGVLLLAVPIPAYEPMLGFLTQVIVVTSALAVVDVRRRDTRAHGDGELGSGDRSVRPHFSLSTLLLVVAVAAVAAAVAARIPADVWAAWVPILGGGFFLAANTLLAAWAAQSSRRLATRTVVLIVMAPLLSIPVALAVAELSNLDSVVFSFWTQFGSYRWVTGGFNWSYGAVMAAAVWASLLAWSTSLLIVFWLALRRLSFATKPAAVALVLLTIAIVLPNLDAMDIQAAVAGSQDGGSRRLGPRAPGPEGTSEGFRGN